MKKQSSRELHSAISHTVATGLSIAVMALLIVFASQRGASAVVGVSTFGAGLISLYAVSSVYHFLHSQSKSKHIMQRVDHAAIVLLIAGSYSAIFLQIQQRHVGWSMLGVLWALSAFIIIMKLSGKLLRGPLSVGLYSIIGWLAVLAIVPLQQWLGWFGVALLLSGGLFYSLGSLLLIPDRLGKQLFSWLSWHDVFHYSVILGSCAHTWLIFRTVTVIS